MRPFPTRTPVARRTALALAVGLVALVAWLAPGSQLVPLDLPASVAEAQTGPGQVSFYGLDYSGDSFVWCIDRSCSMGWDGSLADVQLEVSNALAQLTPNQEFSLVAFNSAFVSFSNTLLPATAANVTSASSWLSGLTPTGTTCPLPALVSSLGILQGASGEPALFYVTDGFPDCSSPAEVIEGVTSANTAQVPLHAIQVGSPSSAVTQYLLELAAANAGTVYQPGALQSDFLRGDTNGDGQRNLADAITLLQAFAGGPFPPLCHDAIDANDDGLVQWIPDAIAILTYLFVAGTPDLPEPSTCGPDLTPDVLPCYVSPCP